MLESLFSRVKKTPTQVFCCKYCEIFKNTYFEEHLQKADPVHRTSHGCGTLVYVTDSISFNFISSVQIEAR